MDNLTHSLIGVLVGETAARTTRHDPNGVDNDTRRNVFVTLMAIGSNVPDLDFIQSRITGSKLDYLLHHRGHTHTIIGAIALSLLLFAACELWCRWRGKPLSKRDRLQFLGIGLLASLLHIALDFTNSYGVHPFWPFDNRWFYGDSAFIVEPLFWSACAPLIFVLRTKLAKVLVALALTAGVVLAFTTGMVPMALGVLLAAVTLAMLAIGKFAPPRIALISSISVWLAVNGVFSYSSMLAAKQTRAIAAEAFPDLTLLDHVLSPMPVNPFCWQLIVVQADEDSWFVRRALLALAPSFIAAEHCPSRSDPEEITAPMSASRAINTPQIVWSDEIETSRRALRDWVAKDCQAAQFMRFARAPWIIQQDAKWIIGDARFDHERALSFAEIELDGSDARCVKNVPPWVAPRDDLLRAEGE